MHAARTETVPKRGREKVRPAKKIIGNKSADPT
jgi:hypothetical protein